MAEVAEARGANGLTVASTFSGAGGSCLGFEMAGYDVRWASEFVPEAADVYALNHPGVHLDRRDIREVQPAEVLAACGLAEGELDVFEGSPPCQSFSMAGKRSRGWGEVAGHADGSHQRADDLFFEYARLLRGLMPRAFVAENVAGLVRGVAKGYFLEILRALRAPGYRVTARVLDAQWLGVPQCRQRVIFMGVREDLGRDPAFPSPLPYRYSLRDALPELVGARMDHGKNGFGVRDYGSDEVVGTVTAGRPATWTAVEEAEVGIAFANGCWQDGEVRSGNEPAPTIMAGGMHGVGTGQAFLETRLPPSRDKAYDGEAAFNFTVADPGKPAPTITVSSPGNDVGHPTERRKFRIDEVKRLCAFPDDFVLTGSYSQQWARLGNSVPPLMMRAVAEVLRDRVLLVP